MVASLGSSSLSPLNGASRISPQYDETASSENMTSGEESNSSDAFNHRARYQEAGSDSALEVKEINQLPSPSLSPSPRTQSPSLAVTDPSNEWRTSSLPAIHARKFSDSFEKPANSSLGPFNNDDFEIPMSPPPPISKNLPPHELHAIPEERPKKSRKLSASKASGEILKLSAAEMEELTSAPESLPVTSPAISSFSGQTSLAPSPVMEAKFTDIRHTLSENEDQRPRMKSRRSSAAETLKPAPSLNGDGRAQIDTTPLNAVRERPRFSSRTSSSVTNAGVGRTTSYSKRASGQTSPSRKPLSTGVQLDPLDLTQISAKQTSGFTKTSVPEPLPSPIPQSIPLPPMSIPTYLQLELSSTRPSPLYIYRSHASENIYESSKVKFERLLNFLLLPPQLEQVLYFGSLACLDAWLYTFTILPLRFFKAFAVLIQWWCHVLMKETQFLTGFIYHGSGRMWHRQRGRGDSVDSAAPSRSASRARASTTSHQLPAERVSEIVNQNGSAKNEPDRRSRQGWGRKHRRTKSHPSSLSSYHKADLLQGAVIICSCIILLKLDASRMYHGIRGQSAIKLYVIYNLLEVCDRLFSAIGQDIFECLFSNETLERDLYGRSKILRPLGMFVLALIYNVIHATTLFYQVIALNVAVNSYENALVPLLMSNQFVEIKSTVFKKFEKDNLFQLTCADVVERFQLWLMLIIIALRNIVEVGARSVLENPADTAAEALKNGSAPLRSTSLFSNSFSGFSGLPSWSGEVLTPFLFVLGSEMGVDWIKHAYISKFNGVKPALYQRFLDILAKDYYTNAFVNQNLVKRLGLPVIPLSCLFIRSSVQTYHMFLATHVSPPIPSTATALSVESSTATTAALEHFDNIIRRALGRSAFGIPDPTASAHWYLPSTDDVIAFLTMLVFFLGAFFVLLACKLILGMVLLRFARNRYRSMKKREHQNYDTGGKRVGGWGMVEVDDDKKRWIYDDDPETQRKLKEREKVARDKVEKGGGTDFSKISRYEMSAKRIW